MGIRITMMNGGEVIRNLADMFRRAARRVVEPEGIERLADEVLGRIPPGATGGRLRTVSRLLGERDSARAVSGQIREAEFERNLRMWREFTSARRGIEDAIGDASKELRDAVGEHLEALHETSSRIGEVEGRLLAAQRVASLAEATDPMQSASGMSGRLLTMEGKWIGASERAARMIDGIPEMIYAGIDEQVRYARQIRAFTEQMKGAAEQLTREADMYLPRSDNILQGIDEMARLRGEVPPARPAIIPRRPGQRRVVGRPPRTPRE